MKEILTPALTCLLGHVINIAGLVFLVLGVKYLSQMREKLNDIRKHQTEENPEGE